MKSVLYILLILIFITVLPAADEGLKGIPKVFDPEYIRSDDYPYLTLDKILSTFYDETKFNQKVCTIGYISRDTTFPIDSGHVLLQRIFVTCCVAHASPVTIYLEPGTITDLKNDEWVKVNGPVVGVHNILGTSPCIKAERIEVIPKPNNPYLNCNACPTEH